MWDSGDAYERFMGRWSRVLAGELVRHALEAGGGRERWLDVGCGTGSVVAAALEAGVSQVEAVEPSPAFVAAAQARFAGRPVRVQQADATTLPAGPFDVVTANLVVNFTPDPVASLEAAAAVLGPHGVGAVSVWDLSSPRSFLARFWAAAERVRGGTPDPADERGSFTVCDARGLQEAARAAGWAGPVVGVEVPTPFADPDDLWQPFLAGVGPASAWLARQDPQEAERIRQAYVADVFGADEGRLVFPALLVTT